MALPSLTAYAIHNFVLVRGKNKENCRGRRRFSEIVIRRHGDKQDCCESTRMRTNCTKQRKSDKSCTLFIRNDSWPNFFLRVSVSPWLRGRFFFKVYDYPFPLLRARRRPWSYASLRDLTKTAITPDRSINVPRSPIKGSSLAVCGSLLGSG